MTSLEFNGCYISISSLHTKNMQWESKMWLPFGKHLVWHPHSHLKIGVPTWLRTTTNVCNIYYSHVCTRACIEEAVGDGRWKGMHMRVYIYTHACALLLFPYHLFGVSLFSLFLYMHIRTYEGEKSRDCAERMITHTMPTNLLLHPSLSLSICPRRRNR